MAKETVIERTRRWIASIVIELNLCPFVGRVFREEKIRYVVSDAVDEAGLLKDLARELKFLAAQSSSSVATTLLIHPSVFENFLDYNDFLDSAEALISNLRLEGILQIASFHPHYQFAGAEADDVENYTNRSPYPMLHLLREESISEVAADPNELLEIPRRNIETLRHLGKEKVLEKLNRLYEGIPKKASEEE